jgi:heme-degrading monooxygenase HmoA
MYSAQFIFKPGTYDEEFHRLDDAIEEFVQAMPGFLGVERWQSADGATKNSIYYFADKETLTEFSRYPDHLTAKAGVQRWYDGYEVVISEVVAAYGDGKIPSIASCVKGKGAFYAST